MLVVIPERFRPVLIIWNQEYSDITHNVTEAGWVYCSNH